MLGSLNVLESLLYDVQSALKLQRESAENKIIALIQNEPNELSASLVNIIESSSDVRVQNAACVYLRLMLIRLVSQKSLKSRLSPESIEQLKAKSIYFFEGNKTNKFIFASVNELVATLGSFLLAEEGLLWEDLIPYLFEKAKQGDKLQEGALDVFYHLSALQAASLSKHIADIGQMLTRCVKQKDNTKVRLSAMKCIHPMMNAFSENEQAVQILRSLKTPVVDLFADIVGFREGKSIRKAVETIYLLLEADPPFFGVETPNFVQLMLQAGTMKELNYETRKSCLEMLVRLIEVAPNEVRRVASYEMTLVGACVQLMAGSADSKIIGDDSDKGKEKDKKQDQTQLLHVLSDVNLKLEEDIICKDAMRLITMIARMMISNNSGVSLVQCFMPVIRTNQLSQRWLHRMIGHSIFAALVDAFRGSALATLMSYDSDDQISIGGDGQNLIATETEDTPAMPTFVSSLNPSMISPQIVAQFNFTTLRHVCNAASDPNENPRVQVAAFEAIKSVAQTFGSQHTTRRYDLYHPSLIGYLGFKTGDDKQGERNKIHPSVTLAALRCATTVFDELPSSTLANHFEVYFKGITQILYDEDTYTQSILLLIKRESLDTLATLILARAPFSKVLATEFLNDIILELVQAILYEETNDPQYKTKGKILNSIDDEEERRELEASMIDCISTSLLSWDLPDENQDALNQQSNNKTPENPIATSAVQYFLSNSTDDNRQIKLTSEQMKKGEEILNSKFPQISSIWAYLSLLIHFTPKVSNNSSSSDLLDGVESVSGNSTSQIPSPLTILKNIKTAYLQSDDPRVPITKLAFVKLCRVLKSQFSIFIDITIPPLLEAVSSNPAVRTAISLRKQPRKKDKLKSKQDEDLLKSLQSKGPSLKNQDGQENNQYSSQALNDVYSPLQLLRIEGKTIEVEGIALCSKLDSIKILYSYIANLGTSLFAQNLPKGQDNQSSQNVSNSSKTSNIQSIVEQTQEILCRALHKSQATDIRMSAALGLSNLVQYTIMPHAKFLKSERDKDKDKDKDKDNNEGQDLKINQNQSIDIPKDSNQENGTAGNQQSPIDQELERLHNLIRAIYNAVILPLTNEEDGDMMYTLLFTIYTILISCDCNALDTQEDNFAVPMFPFKDNILGRHAAILSNALASIAERRRSITSKTTNNDSTSGITLIRIQDNYKGIQSQQRDRLRLGFDLPPNILPRNTTFTGSGSTAPFFIQSFNSLQQVAPLPLSVTSVSQIIVEQANIQLISKIVTIITAFHGELFLTAFQRLSLPFSTLLTPQSSPGDTTSALMVFATVVKYGGAMAGPLVRALVPTVLAFIHSEIVSKETNQIIAIPASTRTHAAYTLSVFAQYGGENFAPFADVAVGHIAQALCGDKLGRENNKKEFEKDEFNGRKSKARNKHYRDDSSDSEDDDNFASSKNKQKMSEKKPTELILNNNKEAEQEGDSDSSSDSDVVAKSLANAEECVDNDEEDEEEIESRDALTSALGRVLVFHQEHLDITALALAKQVWFDALPMEGLILTSTTSISNTNSQLTEDIRSSSQRFIGAISEEINIQHRLLFAMARHGDETIFGSIGPLGQQNDAQVAGNDRQAKTEDEDDEGAIDLMPQGVIRNAAHLLFIVATIALLGAANPIVQKADDDEDEITECIQLTQSLLRQLGKKRFARVSSLLDSDTLHWVREVSGTQM